MKIIKFGILVIFLSFIKKISSLGKKVKVNIPSTTPKAFDQEDEALENEKKLKPTQYLELKKKERGRKNLIKKSALVSSAKVKKNEATEGKEKDRVKMNVSIGILNKNGCGANGASYSETFTTIEKEGVQLQETIKSGKSSGESEVPKPAVKPMTPKETTEIKKGESAERKDQGELQKKDLGMMLEPQEKFLSENQARSSNEIAPAAAVSDKPKSIANEISYPSPSQNLRGNGSNAPQNPLPPIPGNNNNSPVPSSVSNPPANTAYVVPSGSTPISSQIKQDPLPSSTSNTGSKELVAINPNPTAGSNSPGVSPNNTIVPSSSSAANTPNKPSGAVTLDPSKILGPSTAPINNVNNTVKQASSDPKNARSLVGFEGPFGISTPDNLVLNPPIIGDIKDDGGISKGSKTIV